MGHCNLPPSLEVTFNHELDIVIGLGIFDLYFWVFERRTSASKLQYLYPAGKHSLGSTSRC